MKRSLKVPLIMLGTLGMGFSIVSCQEEPEQIPQSVDIRQEFYDSSDGCRKDWGAGETYCQLAAQMGEGPLNENFAYNNAESGGSGGVVGGGGTGTGARVYSGPRYFWHREGNTGYPVEVLRDGSTRPVKGTSIPFSGSSLARASAVQRSATPASYVAERKAAIARGGFGSRSWRLSGGG